MSAKGIASYNYINIAEVEYNLYMSSKDDNDFTKLAERIISFRDARNWKQFHNPKDLAISLVLESTEFLEHFQWKNAEEIEANLKNHKDDIADELADVLYWVLLIANDLDINLNRSLDAKMSKNEAKYPVEKAKGNHLKYTELQDK